MSREEKFYVTTPIYYVNDIPHIGHAYTTVAADVLARYKRLAGFKVFFLTGTDEHGKKVEKTALGNKERPIDLANRVVKRFQDLWERLMISHDDFIRTSEERHKKAVQKFFLTIQERGDIYLGEYEDWYCIPCETFLTEKQLLDGKCPDCLRPTERIKEKSYFFRMSRYQKKLLDHIESHPEFIQPQTRRNEIVSFVKEGLRDLSVSRTSFSWGIPVPGNEEHVVYVWFDALVNYLTAIGYPDDKDKLNNFWPAHVHLIGKDILRFHAVYWPTFLMSAGLPVPEKIFAHGWWTVDGEKMSKSLGNVVDPNQVIDQYGVDAFRYFLLREVPFGMDGDFSHKAIVHRVNSDLANDLGNLFSRSLSMVNKYWGGKIFKPEGFSKIDEELITVALQVVEEVDTFIGELAFNQVLSSIWKLVGTTNRYIDNTSPWAVSKDESQKARLNTVLYNILESLRMLCILISPFMPLTAEKMREGLGGDENVNSWSLKEVKSWGRLKVNGRIKMIAPLFPRIEC
jgi:methionyl-tRNA synthetase